MIETLLIANRGEIASRIIRTASRMGVRTIAVYADVDRNMPFVQEADEAYPLRGVTATETYLNQDKIIAVAKKCRADAIHPGYGFLSENASFAALCAKESLKFIGPPAKAIDAMGDKARAKHLMEQANVPLIPGYHGEDQSVDVLRAQAEVVGYPVLLKASAGGGGKGMRAVRAPSEFDEQLASAQREAKNAFGDQTMLIEKLIEQPRHVEVQIFFDAHGEGVYLFDRDCSIQRRHQKIIEEAPAPHLADATRRKMGETAVACGKAIGYVGAGTVEFLVDKNENFYFMEMNTRLQVEHPVTEMITGLDLVEWQIKVAGGEPLPATQDRIRSNGCAIEARIYAEDPENGFLPSAGALHFLSAPTSGEHTRIDCGVAAGCEISPFYDPMIAKVIGWGPSREMARRRLKDALADFLVTGVTTNTGYLCRIINSDDFIKARLTTGFLEANPGLEKADREIPFNAKCALAALYWSNLKGAPIAADQDPFSPWAQINNWRLNLVEASEYEFWLNGESFSLLLEQHHDKLKIGDGQHWADVSFNRNHSHVDVWVDGVKSGFRFAISESCIDLFKDGAHWRFETPDDNTLTEHHVQDGGSLNAPMGGTIVKTAVQAGQEVIKGDILVVMEAMKMEHSIRAPDAGTVTEVLCKEGEVVTANQILVAFEASGEGA
ncbi:biotin carboxylase N-terminal domain-containing protein [Hahella sp. NBU794]|uniref:acetyl/propionyl/methylcrotonyl-CoA carboxylase subunit alpha n=1 Tax=Hahella sp. NBU794 TaxID=3422590 RepID=UPI003D6E9681